MREEREREREWEPPAFSLYHALACQEFVWVFSRRHVITVWEVILSVPAGWPHSILNLSFLPPKQCIKFQKNNDFYSKLTAIILGNPELNIFIEWTWVGCGHTYILANRGNTIQKFNETCSVTTPAKEKWGKNKENWEEERERMDEYRKHGLVILRWGKICRGINQECAMDFLKKILSDRSVNILVGRILRSDFFHIFCCVTINFPWNEFCGEINSRNVQTR